MMRPLNSKVLDCFQVLLISLSRNTCSGSRSSRAVDIYPTGELETAHELE